MTTASKVQEITCSKCKKIKLSSNFSTDKRNKTGFQSNCNECRYESDKKYKKTKKGLITKIYGNQVRSCKDRGHSKPSYTKKQLYEWIINKPEFHKIYKEWVSSNYKTSLIPSIDRIDDNKSYNFNNIRIVTWNENRQKENLKR